MAQEVLRIAGISDTHFGQVNSANPSPEEYIEHIQDMSHKADVIVHCGDFVDQGSIESAKLAATIFSESTVPIIGVLGNHDFYRDNPPLINKILEEEGGITLLNGESISINQHNTKVEYVGVTGYAARHAQKAAYNLGITEEEYLELVEQQRDSFTQALNEVTTTNVIGITHFPPFRVQEGGMKKKNNPPVKSSFYGELFDLHKNNFRVVFYGHSHHEIDGLHRTKNGIDLINLAAPISISMTPGIPYRIIETPLTTY
jgi:predicted phosphodiesterase